MTTLKEVAQMAGVSIRTVTRALKDEPGGNQETYAKVKAVADRMGYIPNMAARNLKTRQTHIVGIVMSSRHTDVAVRQRTVLRERLESEGKYLLGGTISDGEERLQNMLREWIGLTQDVVFMAWNPGEMSTSRILGGLPMRFIFVGCLDEKEYNTVLTDRSVGVREGVELFLQTGRRRIARFGRGGQGRRTGFDAAFAGVGASRAEKYEITTPGLEFHDGYEAGATIVEHKIDAAFFETDRMAFGFYKFAFERGIKVPDDVAVIGFDDDPAGLYACPPLSTVAHPIKEIADQVLALLQRPDTGPTQTILPTRFIRRQSV